MIGRPHNELLQKLSTEDFELLAPHLQSVDLPANHILHHAGDSITAIHFPCGPAFVSFAVAVEDDREVESLLVGREGAIGIPLGISLRRGLAPAYARIIVKVGGIVQRLPLGAFVQIQQRSASLQDLFTRYAACQLAQLLQTAACNAAHSIEQRAAKWIIATQEHIGRDEIPFTHEQLASMLGVSRSYASRVIQILKARRILATRRGAILILDAPALQASACACSRAVKQHFGEMLGAT